MTTRDPFESYLKKAAVLFEVGDVVQAGQIWQAILKKSPNHEEARAGLYKVKLYFDARATQDGLALERKQEQQLQPAPPEPSPQAPALAPSNELVRMLEQGCTLYDAGHFEDAIAKWELVLEKDPLNVLAKGYITGAQRSLGLPIQGDIQSSSPRNTSALPTDLYLGAGVVPSAPLAEIAPPTPPPPVAPVLDKEEIDRLLRDGCTLYDMGQPEDALRKWEKLLSINPEHALVQAYIKDARRDLGFDTISDGAIPSPVEQPPTGIHAQPVTENLLPAEERLRIEQLIREGTQLFDMGMGPEAILKWEQVLAIVPGHKDAEAYRAMALKEAEHETKTTQPAVNPVEKPTTRPITNDFEPKLKNGESLLQQGRFEEAAFLFQETLKLSPQNFRALQGLHQAQAMQEARHSTHAAPSNQLYPPTPPLTAAPALAQSQIIQTSTGLQADKPVEPPTPLTTPPPPARKGLELPQLLKQLEAEIPTWLKETKVILAILGGVLLLNVVYLLIRWNRGEALLKQKTVSFKEAALVSVARNLEITDLTESPDAIRREAESLIGEDPLRAYYRAQELIRLNPLDGPAAQLMGRASTTMSQAPGTPGSTKELDKLLQGGDLEAAERMLLALLKKSPDDTELKARSARLSLFLAQIYAIKERWDDSEDELKRGRAMFPTDKSWAVRLVFLGRIKVMGAEERKAWVQFLG